MPDIRGQRTTFEWIRELSSKMSAWHIRRDGANPTVDQVGRAFELVEDTRRHIRSDETNRERGASALVL